MNRRKFLKNSSLAAAVLGARFNWAFPSGNPPRPAEREKLKRIGVCSWSLHNFFHKTRDKDFSGPGKMLDLREYPQLIADKYRLHNFEVCNTHFESTDASYIQDLKRAVAKAHGHITNMPVDYGADWSGKGLCDPDETQWRKEIEERKKWIEIAHQLGAASIRPNPGGTVQVTDLNRPIAAYQELARYGKSKGVKVLIENHGNVAAKAENIVAIIKAAGPPWAGTLPDFGNFPESERYQGLELMFPLAQTVCHTRDVTGQDGREVPNDFPRCMEISKKAGYKGVYSIEFAASGDPYDGIQHILGRLLEQL